MIQFEFPLKDQALQVLSHVKNQSQLRIKLENFVQKPLYESKIYLVKSSNNKKNMYAYCKHCTANIRFRKQNQQYSMFYLMNKHQHKVSRKKHKTLWVQNYLKQLPSNLNLSCIKKLAVKELGISENQFYYFYSKINCFNISFQEMISQLKELNYNVVLKQQQNKIPEWAIFISPLMRKRYSTYSDSISVDMTYNLIRKESQQQDEKFKLGAIVSLSRSKRICPVGLIVMKNQSKQNYYFAFKQYFELMGQPRHIVTDEGLAIIRALQQMKKDNKFHGTHTLDSFHILNNVKKKLKKKQNITFFKQLIHAQDEAEFQQFILKAYQKIQSQEISILQKFVQSSQKYCFAHIKNTPIGFSSSSSRSEKTNDLIKSCIPTQKPYPFVINKVLNLFEKLLIESQDFEIDKNNVQQYFNLPEIRILRFRLDKRIFKQLCFQISKIFSYQIYQQNDKRFSKDNKGNMFELKKNQIENIWQCSCQFKTKTNIPCAHLLRLIIFQGEKIINYISERWLISYEQLKTKNQNKSVLGRPRTTRRNMIK